MEYDSDSDLGSMEIEDGTAMEATVDKYPDRHKDDEMFQVIVGKEEKPFTLHAGVASFYSQYFADALKKHQGRNPKIIRLPDQNPDEFSHFAALMNFREDYDLDPEDISTLIDAYVLAERYDSPLLEHLVIKLFFEHCEMMNRVPFEDVDRIYDATTEYSQLRRAFVTLADLLFPGSSVVEELQDLEPVHYAKVLADFIIAKSEREKRDANFNVRVPLCEFHHHFGEKKCSEPRTMLFGRDPDPDTVAKTRGRKRKNDDRAK